MILLNAINSIQVIKVGGEKMAKNVLSVNKIVKRYPNFLLNQISLNLEEGTITGFIGKNGAGKSTFALCLCGLLKHHGTVRINGERISNKK